MRNITWVFHFSLSISDVFTELKDGVLGGGWITLKKKTNPNFKLLVEHNIPQWLQLVKVWTVLKWIKKNELNKTSTTKAL